MEFAKGCKLSIVGSLVNRHYGLEQSEIFPFNNDYIHISVEIELGIKPKICLQSNKFVKKETVLGL